MLPARKLMRVGFLALFCTGMLHYHLALLRPASLSYWTAKGRGNGFYFGTDLYPLWLTSRATLANHADPYTAEMTARIQRELFGRAMDPKNPDDPPQNYRAFSYPVYADYLLLPFAKVPFEKLRLAAVAVLAMIAVLSVLLWLDALGLHFSAEQKLAATALVLTSYYSLEALYAEQIGILVACFLAAAAWCAMREKLSWAGAWLALATIKPQVSLLLIAGTLIWAVSQWSRRRALMIAFFAVVLGLWLAGEWLHRGWLSAWLRVLWHYRDYGTPPLTCFLLGRVGGLLFSAALCCTILVAWIRVRQQPASSRRLQVVIAETLAVTAVAVLPGQAVYDQLIFLPELLLLMNSWPGIRRETIQLRITTLLTAIALAWPWMAALGVSATAAILSPARIRHSVFALRLPLYTIYVFPFLLLALLWMSRKQLET